MIPAGYSTIPATPTPIAAARPLTTRRATTSTAANTSRLSPAGVGATTRYTTCPSAVTRNPAIFVPPMSMPTAATPPAWTPPGPVPSAPPSASPASATRRLLPSEPQGRADPAVPVQCALSRDDLHPAPRPERPCHGGLHHVGHPPGGRAAGPAGLAPLGQPAALRALHARLCEPVGHHECLRAAVGQRGQRPDETRHRAVPRPPAGGQPVHHPALPLLEHLLLEGQGPAQDLVRGRRDRQRHAGPDLPPEVVVEVLLELHRHLVRPAQDQMVERPAPGQPEHRLGGPPEVLAAQVVGVALQASLGPPALVVAPHRLLVEVRSLLDPAQR